MDRNVIPKQMWMQAEDVVAASLGGIDRGKLFVVPGWRYKLVVALVPALPKFLRNPMILMYSKRRQ